MNEIATNITLLILSYLLGSIPFSLVLGKMFKGIDIREHGSKNLGATNAMRVLGPTIGLTVGFFDILKSFAAVLILGQFISISPLYLGVATSIGHVYPLFAKFKGGKAVSTTMGAMFAISPIETLIIVAISFTVVKITKYVSIGATVFGSLIVISAFVLGKYTEYIPRILIFMLLIYRHYANYIRLIKGVENKAKL